MVEALRATLPQPVRDHLTSARELVDRYTATQPASTFPTTIDTFDALLPGGLQRGQMAELIGYRSSGRFSTVVAILAAVTTRGETAALVDLGDGFAPRLAHAAGVVLERLLWVRPERLAQALIATEILLAGGFPLVIIDLGVPPIPGGRGAEAAWLRLARAAQSHHAALLVASPYRASGTAASGVIQAARSHPCWSTAELDPPLLLGLSSQLTLEKLRGRAGVRSGPLHLVTVEAATFGTLEQRP